MVSVNLPEVDYLSPSVFPFEGIANSQYQAVSGLLAIDQTSPLVCVMNITDHPLTSSKHTRIGTLLRVPLKQLGPGDD